MQRGRTGYLELLAALLFFGAALAFLPLHWRMQALAAEMPPGPVPISLSAAAVPLQANDRRAFKAGKLRYMGGLYVTSSERRFGGWSALIVSPDGKKLLSVSDNSYWLLADIEYRDGNLSGLSGGVLAPILDANGLPLRPPWADSESVTSVHGDFPIGNPDGVACLGFETKDRVDCYALGRDAFLARPVSRPMPPEIKHNVPNKGFEGIAQLPDGRLLAITERTLDAAGNMKGWIVDPDGSSVTLSLRRHKPYDLSDLCLAPDGYIYTLERRFSFIGGPGMRIRRIDPKTLQAGAVLDGELIADLDGDYSIDNMEGLSIRRAPDGHEIFYLISDDNYLKLQRTLLLMFELDN